MTLYATLGLEALNYCLDQTEITTVVVDDKPLSLILSLKESGDLKHVENLIVLSEITPELKERIEKAGIKAYAYEEFCQLGASAPELTVTPASPESIDLIMYTSGTTGMPKGVLIPHSTIASNIIGALKQGMTLESTDTTLSFLPLAHSFE